MKTNIRYAVFVIAAALTLSITACGGRAVGGLGLHSVGSPKAPVVPPYGVVYSDFKAPLDISVGGNQQATPADSLRSGMAETEYIRIPFIYISFSWGDASIDAAAANGGINNVDSADYEFFNVLGIYQRFVVHAHGK